MNQSVLESISEQHHNRLATTSCSWLRVSTRKTGIIVRPTSLTKALGRVTQGVGLSQLASIRCKSCRVALGRHIFYHKEII